MAYKAECVQSGCGFVVHAEDDQEILETIKAHTNRKHANMDVLDEDIRERITTA